MPLVFLSGFSIDQSKTAILRVVLLLTCGSRRKQLLKFSIKKLELPHYKLKKCSKGKEWDIPASWTNLDLSCFPRGLRWPFPYHFSSSETTLRETRRICQRVSTTNYLFLHVSCETAHRGYSEFFHFRSFRMITRWLLFTF